MRARLAVFNAEKEIEFQTGEMGRQEREKRRQKRERMKEELAKNDDDNKAARPLPTLPLSSARMLTPQEEAHELRKIKFEKRRADQARQAEHVRNLAEQLGVASSGGNQCDENPYEVMRVDGEHREDGQPQAPREGEETTDLDFEQGGARPKVS